MRGFDSWLEHYNRETFKGAYGVDPGDLDDGTLADLLAWGLGYVDYTKPSIARALLDYATADRGKSLPVRSYLPGSSLDALKQGLDGLVANGDEAAREYEDISDAEFGAMMSYALGFIDYETLARERPLGNRGQGRE